MREPPPGSVVDADRAPSPPASTTPHPPRVVVWLLFLWWTLVLLLGIAILVDLFLLPLLNTPDRYWDGVQSQFEALLALISAALASPLLLLLSGALLLLAIVASLLVERRAHVAQR